MRSRLLNFSVAVVISVGMSACATTPGGTGIDFTQVANLAVGACKFLPTAEEIGGFITSNPALVTASEVADALCAFVSPKSSARARALRRATPLSPITNGCRLSPGNLCGGSFVR